MSILDDEEKSESRSGDGVPKVEATPPPPPPVNHVLSILFAVLALGAVFLRAWGPGVAFAATSLAFNVVAFVQNRAWSKRVADAWPTGTPPRPAGRGPGG
ncbi:MAG TPA: hypothetical protein VEL74_25155 [Thermoanaerobaculia bacterium]|nr:hypothetical protein [Thermoanaerobaculia bacterium]